MSTGCPMHRLRDRFAFLSDGLAVLSTSRNLDTATHLVRALGVEVNGIPQSRASIEVASSGEVPALSFWQTT